MKKIILILGMSLLLNFYSNIVYSATTESIANIQENIETISHVCLIVSNMQKTLNFYNDLLGFKIIYNKMQNDPDMKLRNVILMAPDNFKLELVQFYHPHGKRLKTHSIYTIAYNHIGIKVKNINTVYKILKEHKIQLYNKPTVMDIDKSSYSFFFAEDPDKNYIEFYQNLNPAAPSAIDIK